jgi:hypothetical protein
MRKWFCVVPFILVACSGARNAQTVEISCEESLVRITDIDTTSLADYVYVKGRVKWKRVIILLPKSDQNILELANSFIINSKSALCLKRIFFLKSETGVSIFFYRGDVYVEDKLMFPNNQNVYEIEGHYSSN